MMVMGVTPYFYCNIELCSQMPGPISRPLAWHDGLLTILKKQKYAFMEFCKIRQLRVARLSGAWVEHGSCEAEHSEA